MDINSIIVAIVAFIVGLGGGVLFSPGEPSTETNEHALHGTSSDMHAAMEGMTKTLEGKTGDAFDQAFLSEMIVHHEGAVHMAQAALEKAQHTEIKTLANEIISAQVSEITQMKNWLTSWYGQEAQ